MGRAPQAIRAAPTTAGAPVLWTNPPTGANLAKFTATAKRGGNRHGTGRAVTVEIGAAARLLFELSMVEPLDATDPAAFADAVEEVRNSIGSLLTRVKER